MKNEELDEFEKDFRARGKPFTLRKATTLKDLEIQTLKENLKEAEEFLYFVREDIDYLIKKIEEQKREVMKNFTVKIDEELLLNFRLKCLKNGVSQVSIIRSCIQDYINKLDDIEALEKRLDDLLKDLDNL